MAYLLTGSRLKRYVNNVLYEVSLIIIKDDMKRAVNVLNLASVVILNNNGIFILTAVSQVKLKTEIFLLPHKLIILSQNLIVSWYEKSRYQLSVVVRNLRQHVEQGREVLHSFAVIPHFCVNQVFKQSFHITDSVPFKQRRVYRKCLLAVL